jgi:hypothetical protein
MGIAAPGQGEIRHVGIEELLAARAEMLRVLDEEVDGPLRSGVTHIVEDSPHSSMAVRAVVAVRAGPLPVVAASFDDLRFRQILNACDPLGPIRPVLPGCRHLSSLQEKNFFSPGEIGLERRSLE